MLQNRRRSLRKSRRCRRAPSFRKMADTVLPMTARSRRKRTSLTVRTAQQERQETPPAVTVPQPASRAAPVLMTVVPARTTAEKAAMTTPEKAEIPMAAAIPTRAAPSVTAIPPAAVLLITTDRHRWLREARTMEAVRWIPNPLTTENPPITEQNRANRPISSRSLPYPM